MSRQPAAMIAPICRLGQHHDDAVAAATIDTKLRSDCVKFAARFVRNRRAPRGFVRAMSPIR
jgi:hypothetical protein